MPLFLNKVFKRKERHDRSRDERVFPYPKKSPFTEIFRGFGRKSPYFNTSEGSVQKISQIADINGHVGTSWKKAHSSPQSFQPRCEIQPKKMLSLEELKKTSPPGFEEFEAAFASTELDEETALLLWEDIFKPLSSHFKSLQDESQN